jgi:hypothetical protein
MARRVVTAKMTSRSAFYCSAREFAAVFKHFCRKSKSPRAHPLPWIVSIDTATLIIRWMLIVSS